MRRFLRLILISYIALQARAAHAQTPSSTQPTAQALTLLKKNCFACHNPEKKKGHLLLTSRDLAMRGDDEGPVIIPGKASESRLIQALSPEADPHMPPKKQLDPQEVSSLRAWIDAGAPWDDSLLATAAPTTRPVTLGALPPSYRPVLAIAGSLHLVGFAVILLMVHPIRPLFPAVESKPVPAVAI